MAPTPLLVPNRADDRRDLPLRQDVPMVASPFFGAGRGQGSQRERDSREKETEKVVREAHAPRVLATVVRHRLEVCV